MNVFDLQAILSLDTSKYEQGLDGASRKTSVFGDVLRANLVSNAVISGVQKLTSGVTGMVKESVGAYGEFEQLEGGIQTLFGTGGKTIEEYAASVGKSVDEVQTEYEKMMSAQEKVMANAENAFTSAGMSANDYLNTTIAFSSSLIQGLGGDTEKAADVANMAITDMSDNVNKMGTSMDMVQNAYRGLARQNFTMLDNLSIGYQGTAAEMARLINDSKVMGDTFTATAKNVKEISFDKYIEAIHVIQQQMGITGTTAEEAAKTIQGSTGSMRAAWQNLVAGLSNPRADLGKLIDNFIKSAKTSLKNIIPIFRQALKGIAGLIKEIAPIIAEELPGLVEDVLPPVIEAASALIVALIQNLPVILQTLVEAIPKVMSTIWDAIQEAWPAIVDALLGLLDSTSGRIVAVIGGIVLAVKGMKIVEGIGNIVTAIGNVGNVLPGLTSAWTSALGAIGTAALGVADALLIVYDVQALTDAAEGYQAAADAHANEINTALESYRKLYEEKGKEIADEWAATVYALDTTSMNMDEAQAAITQKIEGYWDGVPQNMWEGFKAGWNSYFGEGGGGLMALMGDAFSGAINGIKGLLGIHSPSTVMMGIGGNVSLGMAQGIEDEMPAVMKAMDTLGEGVTGAFDGSMGIGSYAGRMGITDALRGSGGISAAQGQEFVVPQRVSRNGQELTIVLQLDRMVLGRAVYDLYNERSQTVGVRLAGV